MKKLVAESLFELYGPGYISDLASGNAKKKAEKHDTTRPFPPESDEEKARFNQSEEDDNTEANEWDTDIHPTKSPLTPKFREAGEAARKRMLAGGVDDVRGPIGGLKAQSFRAEEVDNDAIFSKGGPRSIASGIRSHPKSTAPKGEYYPREGTAPYRLLKFFEKHPGSAFSVHEIFKKVDDSAATQHGLEYLVKKGLVHEVHELNPNSGRMANRYYLGTRNQEIGVPKEPKIKKAYKGSSEISTGYTPVPGSSPSSILNLLQRRGEMSDYEIQKALKGRHGEAAVWHAVQYLLKKGKINVEDKINPRSKRKAAMYSIA